MAFAASTIIAGLGVAVAAGGLAYSVSQQKDAANSQAAAARNQAAIGALQASNVDVQQKQLGLQTQQQQLQIASNKAVIQQQQQADDIRQQATQLDSTRRIRESVRQGIVARATSLTAATNQGAGQPGSTATAQSRADIQGQTNVNILGITQQSDFAKRLYDVNKTISGIYLNAQDTNSTYVNQSQAYQSQVLDTQKDIYRLGGDASSNYAQAAISSGNAALGQGLYSAGAAVANAYPAINRLTGYFGSNTPAADKVAQMPSSQMTDI